MRRLLFAAYGQKEIGEWSGYRADRGEKEREEN